MENQSNGRDQWASKIGLVLAMAGSAIGLGNFIRFPMQAAKNGGGAFMIPYIVAFLLLGLPIMFLEWGLGRYGGAKGHATTPGIFSLIRDNKTFRWLGVLGVCIPLFIAGYYCFIESWTLGYSFYSIVNTFPPESSPDSVKGFFESYVGMKNVWAYGFFLLTMTVNTFILYKGISQGIEKAAKIMMPTLFILALVLVIRVLTLGAPDPSRPDWNTLNGLGYIWNPDFSKLGAFSIWIAAAGQIFFTLSLGQGAIICYASYVRKDEDLISPGLATSFTNEVAEVICGGSIAIPLAVAYFGLAATKDIAQSAGLGFGFVSMPMLFAKIPFGHIFGFIWFLLLFFAGITSSICMGSIVVAFLEEIVGLTRKKAVFITMGAIFLLGHLAIFGKGAMDEMDTMAGTLGLTVFALIEVIVWVHVFGIDKSWNELMQGAKIKLWDGIKYITAYVSPIYLLVILVGWLVQDWKKIMMIEGVAPDEIAMRWITRAVMLAIVVLVGILSTSNMGKKKEALCNDH